MNHPEQRIIRASFNDTLAKNRKYAAEDYQSVSEACVELKERERTFFVLNDYCQLSKTSNFEGQVCNAWVNSGAGLCLLMFACSISSKTICLDLENQGLEGRISNQLATSVNHIG
ncbi:hypothetical protein OS493_024904 [Desmophyllum pertusum]|uniref:Uncharacterized protein n=1 Tax=Desmophyllum pertusum TaxID=174260 RepID=A0A9X0CPS9_9CNID|nr:hypothetical protein OS493_024904 [Desmophyllum pertusum]